MPGVALGLSAGEDLQSGLRGRQIVQSLDYRQALLMSLYNHTAL